MPETYSRTGSLMIKKETTTNTAVIPDVALPINSEEITDSYGWKPAMPVQGTRSKNLRAVCDKILAPVGPVELNVEPKSFGYILEGLGDLTTGVYFKSSDADNGDIAVGDTIDNGSTGTGTVVAIDTVNDVILASGVSGDWATGDTIGNSGTHTSTLGTFSATVNGHLHRLPADITNTFTIQRNLADRAYRWAGARFHALDGLGQSDNIMTATAQVMAQSSFRHARVKAAVTAAGGSQTITVDQTQCLVVGDSIKVYRSGTGFLDFSASGVKTHTIDTINADASIVVTALQTTLAEGDLIMLAPITPSFTVDEEFCWVGGSTMSIGATTGALSTFDAQDFTMVLSYELEERHAASGTNIRNRMPSNILQKGLEGSGTFTLHNENEDFYRHYRINTPQAIRLQMTGNEIASTGVYYQLAVTFAEIQFDQYEIPLSQDDIVNEEVPFTGLEDSTNGWFAQVLLVNDVASY